MARPSMSCPPTSRRFTALPSFVCYDELAQVPSRALYDALGTALGGRVQPLMLVISTQAARDEAPMACQHLHVAE